MRQKTISKNVLVILSLCAFEQAAYSSGAPVSAPISISQDKISPAFAGDLHLLYGRVTVRVRVHGCWNQPVLHINKEITGRAGGCTDTAELSRKCDTYWLSVSSNLTAKNEVACAAGEGTRQINYDLGTFSEVFGNFEGFRRIYFRSLSVGSEMNSYYHIGTVNGRQVILHGAE